MTFLLVVLTIDAAAIVFWMKLLTRLQDYRKEKGQKNILKLFFFTGLFSIPVSGQLYTLWYGFFGGLFTERSFTINAFLDNFLVVGPVEELAKFLVFFVTAQLFQSVKEPRDAILQAGSVAMAFAVVENFFYAGWYGSLLLLIERSFLSVLGHMSYAGIWGYAAGAFLYSRNVRSNAYGFSVVLSALIVAAGFHGMFNFLLAMNRIDLALAVDVTTVFLSLSALKYLRRHSPYRTFPLAEWKKAVPVLRQALKASPNNFLLNKRLAIYYLYGGKFSEAGQHFRRALRNKRDDRTVQLYLGVVDYLQGNETDAVKRWNRMGNTLTTGQINRFIRDLKRVILRYSLKDEIVSLLRELKEYGDISETEALRYSRDSSLSYRTELGSSGRPGAGRSRKAVSRRSGYEPGPPGGAGRSLGSRGDRKSFPPLSRSGEAARKGRALSRIIKEKFENRPAG